MGDLQAQLSDREYTEFWRREQLERAGVPIVPARRLAESDADLHKMLDALAAGCSVSLLVKIFSGRGGE